jgi:hypothetical protein
MDTNQTQARNPRKFYVERAANSREELSPADQQAFDGLATYVPAESLERGAGGVPGDPDGQGRGAAHPPQAGARSSSGAASCSGRGGRHHGQPRGASTRPSRKAQAGSGREDQPPQPLRPARGQGVRRQQPRGRGRGARASPAPRPWPLLSPEDLDTAAVLSGLIAEALSAPRPPPRARTSSRASGAGGERQRPDEQRGPRGHRLPAADAGADANAGDDGSHGSDEGEKVRRGRGEGEGRQEEVSQPSTT